MASSSRGSASSAELQPARGCPEARAEARATQGTFVKVDPASCASTARTRNQCKNILLQLWISTRAYAGQARASTWVYRVALNTALSWRRGATRRERRLEPGADVAAAVAPAASPAEAAGDRELLEKLYAAIHAMPEFDRALVLLSLDGLAYREIAEVTENHVGVALTRARHRLANLMKEITDELE